MGITSTNPGQTVSVAGGGGTGSYSVAKRGTLGRGRLRSTRFR